MSENTNYFSMKIDNFQMFTEKFREIFEFYAEVAQQQKVQVSETIKVR